MGKYDPLKSYLSEETQHEIKLTFVEIENIIGEDLPYSARKHRQFWIDSPGIMQRSQNRAWNDAGYTTSSISLSKGFVVFRKKERNEISETKFIEMVQAAFKKMGLIFLAAQKCS